MAETPQGPQSVKDSAVVIMICCTNFVNSVLSISIISYFFWVGVGYLVGATVIASGWRYSSPILYGIYVCPATSNAYTLAALWFIQGALFLVTCWGYSSIDDSDIEIFGSPTTSMRILGFMVKVFPIWARLLHMFNFCQIQVILLDLYLMSECNIPAYRWIIAVIILVWWLIVMFGVTAKRKIFMPPYLYDPLRPGSGLMREVHKLLRGLGP